MQAAGLAGRRRIGATPGGRRGTVIALYAVTLLVSAALVFCVQPMLARFVLPLLGGTPAVWNVSMVFFQVALLASYLYAHASIRRFGPRRQALLHLLLLLPPLLVLPIGVPHGWVAPQRCTRGGSEPWTDDYSDVLTALLGGTSRQTG